MRGLIILFFFLLSYSCTEKKDSSKKFDDVIDSILSAHQLTEKIIITYYDIKKAIRHYKLQKIPKCVEGTYTRFDQRDNGYYAYLLNEDHICINLIPGINQTFTKIYSWELEGNDLILFEYTPKGKNLYVTHKLKIYVETGLLVDGDNIYEKKID